MNFSTWAVLFAGIAAASWVNWYFLLSAGRQSTANRLIDAQRATVRVLGGYDPQVIRVARGVPLQLVFDRQEDASCSDEVVIGAFGIRRYLPPFQKTEIDFLPDKAGTFDVTCGMSMLHASLVVED
jgi:plastocyanin domain-containing protein